jgi:fatty acid CoA ligase FadD21
MQNSSVVSVLRERAGLQPNEIAFRHTGYEQYRQRGFTWLDA